MARGKKKYRGAYYSPKRRAIMARGDKIDALELFEMHGWICCICNEVIDRRLRLPNTRAATIEHVVPLCQGGEHTWANTRPSHADCNWSRGDGLT